ncbi:Protease PrtS [Madurella fahalii]|uniref:Protease PrtS n=1 Tax=Madurella fahalii TaxID=1157608 RepID=A0ABQ0GJ94_9PEZI
MDCQHYVCSIVPRYLLESLCECDDEEVRHSAHTTLAVAQALHTNRHEIFELKCSSHGGSGGHHNRPQGIVPGTLLQAVVDAPEADEESKAAARDTLAFSERVREDRAAVLAAASGASPTVPQPITGMAKGSRDTETGFMRSVYDMQNGGNAEDPSSFDLLPGKEARMEGQDATSDEEVNEAYDMALQVLQFYKKFFNYDSLDGQAMEVKSSVHFGKKLGNAFWLGGLEQMVYGDGNSFLHNFTGCIDVIGHEMTHAVIQYTAALVYRDEAGALNEHIADAFGIMVKQMYQNETAAEADWLIGEDCLLPGVKGVALRSMKSPGTAYNDPRFGSDLQPSHTDQIPELMKKHGSFIKDRDYGGVHVFSGIPNRAFHIAAVAFGGYTWEKAGKIWWKVVSERTIPPNCTFVQFADATVDAAEALFDEESAKIVRDAWNQVGVVRKV